MIRADRRLAVNGDGRTPGIILRHGDTAAKKRRGPSDAWQSRISDDRPVYGCPECREAAMQFYAIDPSIPDRTDCFRCHACGTCWEI